MYVYIWFRITDFSCEKEKKKKIAQKVRSKCKFIEESARNLVYTELILIYKKLSRKKEIAYKARKIYTKYVLINSIEKNK